MGCILIEDNVVEDIKLNSTDKIVYGLIKALSNNKGYCYASNSYIGNKSNLSKSTVSNTVRKLKKFNYIKPEIIDNKRRIYIKQNTNNMDEIC